MLQAVVRHGGGYSAKSPDTPRTASVGTRPTCISSSRIYWWQGSLAERNASRQYDTTHGARRRRYVRSALLPSAWLQDESHVPLIHGHAAGADTAHCVSHHVAHPLPCTIQSCRGQRAMAKEILAEREQMGLDSKVARMTQSRQATAPAETSERRRSKIPVLAMDPPTHPRTPNYQSHPTLSRECSTEGQHSMHATETARLQQDMQSDRYSG